jgi:hypothetical protein
MGRYHIHADRCAPLVGALMAVPVAVAFAVQARWGVFVLAAYLCAILAVRAPAAALAVLLSLSAVDLVLTVEVAAFTFRVAQAAAVTLSAAAVAQAGLRAYLRFVLRAPGMVFWCVLGRK